MLYQPFLRQSDQFLQRHFAVLEVALCGISHFIGRTPLGKGAVSGSQTF